MHSNMACARGMIMHLAEPQSPCQSFVFVSTTKFIHKNCGCGLFPLNVFRCREAHAVVGKKDAYRMMPMMCTM